MSGFRISTVHKHNEAQQSALLSPLELESDLDKSPNVLHLSNMLEKILSTII